MCQAMGHIQTEMSLLFLTSSFQTLSHLRQWNVSFIAITTADTERVRNIQVNLSSLIEFVKLLIEFRDN